MKICALIAEFNPFHSGHEHLIKLIKSQGYTHVIVIMSGNFMQRGEPAIIPKEYRVKSCLKAGADLVIELPVVWALSTAEIYAQAGVKLVNALGCVDDLVFGSECGDISALCNIVQLLEQNKFDDAIKQNLKLGITFAKARQLAVKQISKHDHLADLLSYSNNILGVEYIKALKTLKSNIKPVTFKRLQSNQTKSASQIREMILNTDKTYQEYIPKYSADLIEKALNQGGGIHCLYNNEKAILSFLKTKTIAELKALPDISEGIENKIFKAIESSTDLDELFKNIKSKRYTMSRIKRIILSAYLGINKQLIMQSPPYLRVLGTTGKGLEILKIAKSTATLPIVTKFADVKSLTPPAQDIFNKECLSTDLYSFFGEKILPSGTEKKFKLIKGDL